MDDLIPTEPDCPSCGTRTLATRAGIFVCRVCKVPVHPAVDLAQG
ncbi:hypothetical protein [Agromyces sp. NPDC058064]